jgi:hypothetical protein
MHSLIIPISDTELIEALLLVIIMAIFFAFVLPKKDQETEFFKADHPRTNHSDPDRRNPGR